MSETELRHVIALLLEDAECLQQLEPNAGTKARIWIAKNALESGDKAEGRACNSSNITPYLLRLKEVITILEGAPESEEKKGRFLAELKFIESELK
ncbi:hypothetical protein JEQ07_12020 [Serratia proteamaculans]|uniref:Uncharacterized protein n=1 Tax=Serratia proteamaculans TaxID=28151 RepID=A0ABS0TS02_SERPR|nr:hypothetical protein [Serratia proteamaculans]MBI6181120.1 hypothetical protein [Serratia proteamaculans]